MDKYTHELMERIRDRLLQENCEDREEMRDQPHGPLTANYRKQLNTECVVRDMIYDVLGMFLEETR